jgi:hypothetical protein
MLVEAFAYADLCNLIPLSDDEATRKKVGYILLNIVGQSVAEFITFSTVTHMWFRTLSGVRVRASEEQRMFRLFPGLLLMTVIILVLHSVWEIVDLWHYNEIIQFRLTSKVHTTQILIQGLAWALHGILVITCVGMTYRQIVALPTISQIAQRTKATIIASVEIPMIICGICYLLRSIFLFTDFASHNHEKEISVGYWVWSTWVPTFVPAIMLLYTARKRDRHVLGTHDVFDPSGLPPTGPPEDVFLRFRNRIFSGDGADESFMSPPPVGVATESVNEKYPMFRPLSLDEPLLSPQFDAEACQKSETGS